MNYMIENFHLMSLLHLNPIKKAMLLKKCYYKPIKVKYYLSKAQA